MSLMRAVAVVEVVAGALGLVMTLMLLGSMGTVLGTVAFLLGLAFFSVNLWAGIELWYERPRGLALSIAVWAVQVPQVLAPFELYFLAGPYLTLRMSSQLNVGLDFGAQAGFILLDAGHPGWHFGLNVVALCLVLLLVRLQNEREKRHRLLTAIEQEEHRRAINAA